MMRSKTFGRTALLSWALPGLLALGADEPKEPTPEEIAKRVAELDADEYDTREAATERLAAIGKPAIPAIEKAAAGESLEVTLRAVEILDRLRGAADEETRTATGEALERLAACEHDAASRQAKKALAPKVQEPQVFWGGGPLGGVQIGGLQIGGMAQIVIGGGGARTQTVSVRNVNGVKEIDATEDGRKIHIQEGPPDGIRMEITATKDGKEKTDKYVAKDAEELKKKHPEAYKVYKEYSENRAAATTIQFQFGEMLPPAHGSVESVSRRLRTLAGEIEGLADGEELRQASPQAKADLREQIAELKKKLIDLEERMREEEKEKAEEKPAKGE